ncbi:MAG: hypothetical protein K6C36_06475 [Clostridia bacterium]|nr:hypothetical protein [Clostridia bacterium]
MSYDFNIPSFMPEISLYIAYLKQVLEMLASLFNGIFNIKVVEEVDETTTVASDEG